MARKIMKRRTFTEEFKNQIVQLHNNGKKNVKSSENTIFLLLFLILGLNNLKIQALSKSKIIDIL